MAFALPVRVLWRRHKLERSCGWDRAHLEAHQDRAARELRQFAYARSPFYRRFHKGLENQPLAGLPILTKGELMENFDQMVTDPSIRLRAIEDFLRNAASPALFDGRYVVLSTSGSTGRRGVFLFSQSEWIHALALITRPLVWAGMSPNPLRRRRAAIVASTVPWHYSARVSQSLASRFLPSIRIDAAEPLDSIVRRLNAWRPELLAAYPSLLRPLAEEQLAGRLSIPVRFIATSAEVLTPEARLRVRHAWEARISDTYGGTEYAPIAAECIYGRKHLVEDSAIVEIVDERGRPVPDGAYGGRVLLTVFDRFTQPLIRYEISDMVRPAPGACECGRPFRLIDAIEGRTEDILRFPAPGRGTVAIHPNIFHELLEPLPVAGWQVVQEEDALRVLLLAAGGQLDLPVIANSIAARLEKEGALAPRIEVRPVAALMRGLTGKAPLIQAHRSLRTVA